MAALLSYPSPELVEALPELEDALAAERMLSPDVATLIAGLESSDIWGLQERYVDLFDRVPSLSLHLFEHVHGQTRDRGQAMVELKALYAQQGLILDPRELPDYLPAFLEYLSLLDAEEARRLLSEAADVLRGIGARLDKRGSPYAAVFASLLRACASHRWESETVSEQDIRAEDDPAALDRAWAEEPAFGKPAGCAAAIARAVPSAVRPSRAPQPQSTDRPSRLPLES
jgi:nitrate reductase delta subunit